MSNSQHSVAEKSAVYEIIESAGKVGVWPRVPLPEAVELNPKAARGSMSDDFEVSFVPMTAVEAATGRLDASAVRKYADVRKGYTYFREGDVLFAKITPCMENGKMVVARGLKNRVGFGSTEFHVLRPREGVDASYIYHFVSSANFRRDAAHLMTGAVGQKRVPLSFLEQAMIPLPSLDRQRSIVAEIEKQFSRLDEAVANLKRVKANLKRYKAAVLKAAVEGCLVETEAELARREGRSYETGAQLLQRILETRRSQWKGKGKYKEPAAPDTTDLPELPGGWVWSSVSCLGEVIGGLTKNPKRAKLPRKLPYLRVANVYANELRLEDIEEIGVEESELDKLLVIKGDLLIVEGNGSPEQIGRLAIWDGSIKQCVHQNHLIKVRLSSECLPQWVLGWLMSSSGRNYIRNVASSTSGLYTLSVGKVGGLPVPLPPVAEQQKIILEVERRLSFFDQVDAHMSENTKRSERLRSSILAAAFSAALSG